MWLAYCLHLGGKLVGKPGCADVAVRRWKAMAGGTGELLTGHAAECLHEGAVIASATGSQSTLISFGTLSTEEIKTHVGTGEPAAADQRIHLRWPGRLIRRRNKR